MNVNEPVALDIKDREGRVRYMLTAYAKDGRVVVFMTTPSGTPYALSALQAGAGMPRIARRGWQAQLVAWIKGGLYKNVEER